MFPPLSDSTKKFIAVCAVLAVALCNVMFGMDWLAERPDSRPLGQPVHAEHDIAERDGENRANGDEFFRTVRQRGEHGTIPTLGLYDRFRVNAKGRALGPAIAIRAIHLSLIHISEPTRP